MTALWLSFALFSFINKRLRIFKNSAGASTYSLVPSLQGDIILENIPNTLVFQYFFTFCDLANNREAGNNRKAENNRKAGNNREAGNNN